MELPPLPPELAEELELLELLLELVVVVVVVVVVLVELLLELLEPDEPLPPPDPAEVFTLLASLWVCGVSATAAAALELASPLPLEDVLASVEVAPLPEPLLPEPLPPALADAPAADAPPSPAEAELDSELTPPSVLASAAEAELLLSAMAVVHSMQIAVSIARMTKSFFPVFIFPFTPSDPPALAGHL